MMELSLASVLEWTKLTIRDPRLAALLVKAAKLPLQVSILMIVLAGVLTGVVAAIVDLLVGPQSIVMEMADGQTLTFTLGPMAEGGYGVAFGLALGFALYRIGDWMGGQGSLADVMSVTAVLQLVMTVVLIVEVLARLIVPFLGTIFVIFGLVIFLRGLGHAVNVAHDFDDMGKSAAVIAMSFVAAAVVTSIAIALLGLSPQGVIEGTPL